MAWERMCLHQDFCDLVIIAGGESIFSHKLVLASRSPYFARVINSDDGLVKSSDQIKIDDSGRNVVDIELGNRSLKSLNLALKYIYSYKLNMDQVTDQIIIDLLSFAHQFEIQSLAIHILQLFDHTLINSDNVWPLYEASKNYKEDHLIVPLLKFIDENANVVLNHDYFPKLDSKTLKEIFARDNLAIEEIEVFNAVHKWLNEQKPSADIKNELVSLIRLSLITVDDYLGTVRKTNFFSDSRYLDAISDSSLIEKEKRIFQPVYKFEVNMASPSKDTTAIAESNDHLSNRKDGKMAPKSCSPTTSKKSDDWYIRCIRNSTNRPKLRGRTSSERFLNYKDKNHF